MEQGEASPPVPAEHEAKCDTSNNEEEGELFDFDSGDEVPEADRQVPSADDRTRGAEAGGADENTCPAGNGTGAEPAPEAEPAKLVVPTKVNPYSVIDITPLQEDQPSSPDANTEEEGVGLRVPSGYSVPVPCGYAVPSNLPLLLPAYSSPVIIRAESVEEEEAAETVGDGQCNSLSSEDLPHSEQGSQEGSALARWAADPANTAWMENPEEAIYDDVPRENSDSEPDEMIYDDVENGEEGGNSSPEYGWSSSEFESYEEPSDSEGKNGIPRSFLRSSHKKQMQKLMKAAKEGTKDGLEKTKAAVKRGGSFIRTRSLVSQGLGPILACSTSLAPFPLPLWHQLL